MLLAKTASPVNGTDAINFTTGPCSNSAVAQNPAFEQAVVELLNQERAAYGLPPLKRSADLDAGARYHSSDMQADGYFNHDSYDRVSSTLSMVCEWSARVGNFYPNWFWLGENIAIGYSSPQSVVAAWMASPGHRANILQTEFWEVGVGYATGNYWVQDFGRPSYDYPLVINKEAAATSSAEVELYIYGTWELMRLRNDGGDWSAWVPFTNQSTWKLTPVAGNRTVRVELRKGSQIATSSDSIELLDGLKLLPVLFLPMLGR